MTLTDFKNVLNEAAPPDSLAPLLEALWYDAQGDWDAAHQIAQKEAAGNGAWVHAYLHRKEGDLGNASFWYARAGKKMPDSTLDEEWETIANQLLKESS